MQTSHWRGSHIYQDSLQKGQIHCRSGSLNLLSNDPDAESTKWTTKIIINLSINWLCHVVAWGQLCLMYSSSYIVHKITRNEQTITYLIHYSRENEIKVKHEYLITCLLYPLNDIARVRKLVTQGFRRRSETFLFPRTLILYFRMLVVVEDLKRTFMYINIFLYLKPVLASHVMVWNNVNVWYGRLTGSLKTLYWSSPFSLQWLDSSFLQT